MMLISQGCSSVYLADKSEATGTRSSVTAPEPLWAAGNRP